MAVSAMSPWALLGVCIALEVLATSLLKASNGFERPFFGVASIMVFSILFWILSHVLTRLPVGVVYAIWAGLGIALITLVGYFVFDQRLSLIQLACIGLILLGAVGLNLTTTRTL